eukprot:TRINITY_DN14670_c0_g1_i1.p1 TRINITY_DN14670_c0_g1~~TRINITY_DN14670_c0_g1_i1.p1  ORF type:complete len:129 (+),score=14.54 TRINITY_DN14670_c0_g1_i1:77-463(+)
MDKSVYELVSLTELLLKSIANSDWQMYSRLCDESLSCFEPEAQGSMVEGLEFHKFYFDLASAGAETSNVTMSRPHVRMLGPDAAVVSYVRLIQSVDPATNQPRTQKYEETRVWQRLHGVWKHVHFHRS